MKYRNLPRYIKCILTKHEESPEPTPENLFTFEGYEKTGYIDVELITNNIINMTVTARTTAVQSVTKNISLEAGTYQVYVRMKRISGKRPLRVLMQKNSVSGEYLFSQTISKDDVVIETDYEYNEEFTINENITLVTRCLTSTGTSITNQAGDKLEYEINIYEKEV